MASVFSWLPKVIEPFQKCQVKWKSTGQYVLLKVGLFLGESCPLTSFFCFHSTDYTYYIYFVITAKYRYKYQQSASIIGYLVQISLTSHVAGKGAEGASQVVDWEHRGTLVQPACCHHSQTTSKNLMHFLFYFETMTTLWIIPYFLLVGKTFVYV